MNDYLRRWLLLVVVSAVLCATLAIFFRRGVISQRNSSMTTDPASNANFNQARIEHFSLKWNVDFAAARINGIATLTIKFLEAIDQIILDGRSLEMKKVRIGDEDLKFTVENADIFGEKISINVGQHNSGDVIELIFEYSTGAECTALQFMRAEQTADKKGPYLFSQCQPIHARSLLPCMDTPSVKQTYDAEVRVPKGLTCLMSAIGKGAPREDGNDWVFSFNQPVPIPSYLLAVVVGVLEKRDISERCAVWSEPSIVDKAKYEFAEAEKMLATAEALAGKYVWGRYDMVVLPPSFPFGGMENPCLTFVTPTLLAGDQSMANVIAHEIAHSWTGNLVTNANWEHFWLNEGLTVFLERKIIGILEGEEMRQFEAQVGWEDHLIPAIKEQYTEEHPYTRLVQDHKGIDPDDAYSAVPYEKGSALLMYLEQQLGDSTAFEQFLARYIKKFSGKSVVTSDWKDFLYESFPQKKSILDGVNWKNWLYDVGVPLNKPNYDGHLLREAASLARRWMDANDTDLSKFTTAEFKSLSSPLQIKVLDIIYAGAPLPKLKVARLDEVYNLTATANCDLQCSWIRLALKARWEPIIPTAIKFVTNYGRVKYLRPIYKDLFLWTKSATEAIAQFKKNVPFMHPISVSIVEKLIPK
uniref:Leuk-A4-hydro_C domain-containing protein n=1 Tax=Ascaris lumbricoides TaxID=6252 RepID=A0A0M3I5S5_ASCLU